MSGSAMWLPICIVKLSRNRLCANRTAWLEWLSNHFQWQIWFIVIRQTKHDSNAVYYFSGTTNVGCFFIISGIYYIFRLWLIIKSQLKQISIYLLSLFRIRIVLTCPDNKSARNHQPKSCVPAKSHKLQWCKPGMRGQYFSWKFVPVRVKTREYHH